MWVRIRAKAAGLSGSFPVIDPEVQSQIRRDRLQQEDRNHEAIRFLSGEPFCHDFEGRK